MVLITVNGALHANENTGSSSPITGFINITVESNVNKVMFSYPLSGENINGEETHRGFSITVPVKDFRCDNKIAFKDFISLLKADRFPDLSITIPGDMLERLHTEDSLTLHNVMINIAGVTRAYDIRVVPQSGNTSDNLLTGTITLGLSDLSIQPPVKLFGMVKVKDKVIVRFGLGLKKYFYARDRN
jgi:hypothetical protein